MASRDPSDPPEHEPVGPRLRVLWVSTFAFTVLFAVWLMLGVLGLEIKKDASIMLGGEAAAMSVDKAKAAVESRFEWLLAVAILAGSLPRLHFGIWADQYGGRNLMVALLLLVAIPTFLFARATSYSELLVCAAMFGLAGNAFTIGIAWNSAWFPARQQGTALGIFGAGNVGASGTKLLVLLVPSILVFIPAGGYFGGLIPGGWRFVPTLYAGLLVATAALTFFVCPSVDRLPGKGRPLREMLSPLRSVQVWRFSLYYIVVFGAYVALSAWLPSYYQKTFGLDLRSAALLTALFIFPASLLRPLGGFLSDRFGPRQVTYAVFMGMMAATIPLCLPTRLLDLGVVGFTLLMVAIGVGMGIGKASVYKYIPNYYPRDVGAVGGLVGMLGALGGFLLPPTFGILGRWSGSPQAAFFALLALIALSLAWLHVAVTRIKRNARTRAAEAIPMEDRPAHLMNERVAQTVGTSEARE